MDHSSSSSNHQPKRSRRQSPPARNPQNAEQSLPGVSENAPQDDNRKLPPSTSQNKADAVPNLLLKLLEACAKHKRRHENDETQETSASANKKCLDELKTLSRVLPRVESCTNVKDTQYDEYYCMEINEGGSGVEGNDSAKNDGLVGRKDQKRNNDAKRNGSSSAVLYSEDGTRDDDDDDVKHLCALYRAIARGTFCPHAALHLFGNCGISDGSGKGYGSTKDEKDANDISIAKGILPKIVQMLQYLVLDPTRVALSQLGSNIINFDESQKQMNSMTPKRKPLLMPLYDAVNTFHHEEDIGATIAALLNLLEDQSLRLKAVQDLIHLSNDLNTIDKSQVLFDPKLRSGIGEDTTKGDNKQSSARGKIRVHVFTELSNLVQKKSWGNLEQGADSDGVIDINSRRSLLALQLGTWTALQHLLPLLFSDPLRSSICLEENFPQRMGPNTLSFLPGSGSNIRLLSELMSSARPLLLVETRPSFDTPQFLTWRYSDFDLCCHSSLILRTKLSIVDIMTKMVYSNCSPSFLVPINSGYTSLVPGVDLALLAAETAKSHLKWIEALVTKSSKANSQQISDLEYYLNLFCSWGISNLVIHSILFPDHVPTQNDVWLHSFPYLVDCIPSIARCLGDSMEDEKCLFRAIIRAIHAILLNNSESCKPTNIGHFHPVRPNSLIELFTNRCLALGYFSHLFELTMDSLASISGPAVSIVVRLIEWSSLSPAMGFGQDISEGSFSLDSVEISCQDAIRATESIYENEYEPIVSGANLSEVEREKKRRKLPGVNTQQNNVEIRNFNHYFEQPPPAGASIFSSLAGSIADALAESKIISNRAEKDYDCDEHSGGSKIVSLISMSDVRALRKISGILRVLLSLRSLHLDANSKAIGTTTVIKNLFQCIRTVSDMLMKKKNDRGDLCYVEPHIFEEVLSSLVSVGLHLCWLKRDESSGNQDENLAREAISHVAIESLSLIDCCRNGETMPDTLDAKRTKICGNLCVDLCSLLGVKAGPYKDVCLCRLACGSFDDFSSECGLFTFHDVLPFQCQCIFLAALFPVKSNSEGYGSTLSSVRCNLRNSSSTMETISSLISLPILLSSLAISKETEIASSAKYLKSLLDSIDLKNLIAPFTDSSNQSICCAAYRTLSGLARIYSSASLAVVKGTIGHGQNLTGFGSSYFWYKFNPSTHGLPAVINNLLSPDDPFSTAAMGENLLHRDFFSSVLSKEEFCMSLLYGDPVLQSTQLIYLQTIVSFASKSLLRESKVPDFFTDKQHYAIFDSLSQEMNKGTEHQRIMIPPPVWLFVMPFIGKNEKTQELAAKYLGQILCANDFKLFSSIFMPKDEQKPYDVPDDVAKAGVDALFLEIEYLIASFCKLCQNLLFCEKIGSTSEHMEVDYCISCTRTAILLYQTLCQYSPLDSSIGRFIFQRSLLGVVRIWVSSSGGCVFDCDSSSLDTEIASSISSAAFDGLREIFRNFSTQSLLVKLVHDIMPQLFTEFLIPSLQTIEPPMRYKLFTVFVETFLLPNSAFKGLPAQHGLEVPNVIEITRFIDSFYPIVIASKIVEEDLESLQMCAAFRMYLISEASKLRKEEKKLLKKKALGIRIDTRLSTTSSRSLVPGVAISVRKLMENTKLLCVKGDVIEYVLPKLLLHPSRGPLKFFTASICQSEVNFSEILREKGLTLLKTLVWELGADDLDEDSTEEMYEPKQKNVHKRKNVLLALKKGVMLKEGRDSSNVENDDSSSSWSIESWIAPNFMYLLVNIVLNKWKSRSDRDKFQAIKCLRAMLHFLPPSDSPKYIHQIMSSINNAISPEPADKSKEVQYSKLRLVAVSTLLDFTKIVAAHDASQLEENFISIIVTVFPLFKEDENVHQKQNLAREKAVEMLEWLAKNYPSFFSEIPFLPAAKDLHQVRRILTDKGIHLDELLNQSASPSAPDAELPSKFYNIMSLLSQLIMHENKNVRKVTLVHMARLIRSNRGLFLNLIENEEMASMHFLTVTRKPMSQLQQKNISSLGNSIDEQGDGASLSGGFVTILLTRLLTTCVSESDNDVRDAIASCIGEIGAIDPNKLGKEINSSQVNFMSEKTQSSLEQAPWKIDLTDYELQLVTNQLVSGLRSAPTTLDQHKISFAIQELLKLLDSTATKKNKKKSGSQDDGGNVEGDKKPMMSLWLREKLEKADVVNIVEPFWTTNYKQYDTAGPKSPPFFLKSNSYFSWLSSLCRYLVSLSGTHGQSICKHFFYACRSAIRSQAGISVAEFLLPLLILDSLCFGKSNVEDIIVEELLAVLSCENVDDTMSLREREKAVTLVFMIVDKLKKWAEHEKDQKFRYSRGRSKRVSEWPIEVCVSKIENLIKRIPRSTCARAAHIVGKHARALQFLEEESRSFAVMSPGSEFVDDRKEGARKERRYLESVYLDGIDLQLTQTLLGELNDFDTMAAIAQRKDQSNLLNRLTEKAKEREMYGDWEGALQVYEQLLGSRLNNDNQSDSNKGFDYKTISVKMLRCLLKLGRLDSVLNQAYGISKHNIDAKSVAISNDFLPSAVEASWRLGKWETLETLVNDFGAGSHSDTGYELSLGQTMLSLHSRSPDVMANLKKTRECVMTSLSSAARDGYTRSYPYLMQLHALQEIEQISSILSTKSSENSVIDIMSSREWKHRLNLTTPDITGSNVIIDTRLSLCRTANEPAVEGSMWLEIGKMARKGSMLQVSEYSLTQADVALCESLTSANSPARLLELKEMLAKVKLQFAKLKLAQGESTTALKLIEKDIPASIFHMNDVEMQSFISGLNNSDESRESIGQKIFQATHWIVGGGLKSGLEIRSRFQTVLKLTPKWERAHFHYAKYLDFLLEGRISQPQHGIDNGGNRLAAIRTDEVCQKYLIDSVCHYASALQLGQKHVYQALPRLLALWLEFTSIDAVQGCSEEDEEIRFLNETLRRNQQKLNRHMASVIDKIPEHLFYTALPQLISCVLHRNSETKKNVAQILTSVLIKYPRQAMWSCGWLRFSKSTEKSAAGKEIFSSAMKVLSQSKNGKLMHEILEASNILFSFFIKVARYEEKGSRFKNTMKMNPPDFPCGLKNFIPPIQAALSITPGALDGSDNENIFPPFVPRMRAINPILSVMSSKAKPKKLSMFAVPATVAQRDSLSVVGNPIPQDVGEMHFLVKQEIKGDLRKDSRVQDLNNVINRLFKSSSGPNKRRQRLRLNLRTFSVVCLSEDCGILEWVPNTSSLRSLITETVNPLFPPESIHRRGARIADYGNPELRNTFQKCQNIFFQKGNLSLAAKKFDEHVLKQYLPVMYWWFVQSFSNPHAWFEARTNFTLSAAVWSAVGHIIGLGDRHSENILIDTRNGECVHVDFDCIFDKGLTLQIPEVIPFRLTPNMLDAFGPTGEEGLYTGALIESMKTLRKNRDTLLSVLEPFLKDPVINFQSKNQQKIVKAARDAKISFKKIEDRLKGVYNLENPNLKKYSQKNGNSPDEDITEVTMLSVEGQVQKMIMEAKSHENLVQVYGGWMPWV